MALTLSLAFIGPWPVDNSSFQDGEPQRRTLARLDLEPRPEPAGPIRVGVAEVDLTPDSPRPLAGFIGQIRTPFVGVDTRCYARALTVESKSNSVTILTADLLLINAKMARAVVERAGLRPDQVYFTSSHTHGGPGGWGDHPLEMLVAGAYDPRFFETLADQLADVVKRSRAGTEPSELGFVQVQTHDRQRNRVDPSLPTHDALSALVFRPLAPEGAPPLAILAVFGAHATVSHPVPPRLGGDYPASLASELKRRTGTRMVLFASGAVGDASPSRPKAASQPKSAEALGVALAGDLLTPLPSVRFVRDVTLGNLRLDVDMPPVRLPFFSSWLRFSPFLTWWIADRRTHLHAVRLGPAILVGFPGDYSGHLADRLDESTRASGLLTVATSFDGDFRGYLVSDEVFRRRPCYETRWMSFYGPWTGEYFNDLAGRMVDRLSDRPGESVRTISTSADLAPRIALGLLLAVGVAGVCGTPQPLRAASRLIGALRTRPDRSPGLRSTADPCHPTQERAGRRGAYFIVGVALVAFVVDPDLVAWAKFGLPNWVRMLGLPLGLAGLRGSKKSAWMFGAGCGLLAASWVVVLVILRTMLSKRFPKLQVIIKSGLTTIRPAKTIVSAQKQE